MHKPFPERPALLFDLVFPSRSENFLLNLGIADAHGLTPTFAGLGAQNNAVPCPCDSSLHASRVYRIPMAEALEALVMLVGGNRESSRTIYEAFNMFDVRDAQRIGTASWIGVQESHKVCRKHKLDRNGDTLRVGGGLCLVGSFFGF